MGEKVSSVKFAEDPAMTATAGHKVFEVQITSLNIPVGLLSKNRSGNYIFVPISQLLGLSGQDMYTIALKMNELDSANSVPTTPPGQ